MLKWLDQFFATFFLYLKQPIESFIRLETAADDMTLVAEDGSLISFIRVEGARQIIGPEEYERIVEDATVKLGARFDRPGYAMQIHFTRDPERSSAELKSLLRPPRASAKAVGMDVQDLLNERSAHLANFLSWEATWFVLWTRPASLTKSEMERDKRNRRKKSWPLAEAAQFPLAALDSLRSRHHSFVVSVLASLGELGLHARQTDTHGALRAVRMSLYPSRSGEGWKPCLPGDPIPPRAPSKDNDFSDVLWPKLSRQICVGDAEVKGPSTVRVDDYLWSSVDMTLAPMEPSPFPQLLGRLVEANVPFRISFLIESGGIGGTAMKKFVASVLGFTNDINKQIKTSLDALTQISHEEPVVRLRISMATWAHHSNPDLLEERVAGLVQAVEAWGYCQVSQIAGDPLEGVMSSALGIACASTAPAAIAPLSDVMRLLPWQRPSSPFTAGPVLFRTEDGRVWPYQTGSTLTTTWFDLIFAQPGAGKSVLMNALSFGTCLSSGLSKLPYIAIIDIGPSSSGLISLVRESLPPDRQHEAAHYRLRMTPDYSINPFDTQLGCREPLPDERSYLVSLLVLLCTPPGQEAPYDGITQLAGLVIDEMFRWRNDSGANAEPRPYLSHIDDDVDAAIKAHDLHLSDDAYWWDVVDGLFEKNAIHEAGLAQRYAVPTLTDAVTGARRPQIRSLLEETRIGAGAESVIHAFERMITSAIREYPILGSVTRFDISDSRVCALDLGEIAPQGDEAADRQTAIMYMLARHALVRHWWLGEDILRNMPIKYRSYHEARARDIRETPKRLCYDEFHRTSKSPAVRAQVVRDVREGRKWGVQIVLASQLLEDFDADMVDLATGVWILGAAVSDRAVSAAAERFGLSETARWIMRHRLTGPRATGAPSLLVMATNEGRYEQFLINTLGPIELWALSTSAEDVAIRTQLYSRLGAAKARQMLAVNFPGGSARQELKRRTNMRIDKGEIEQAATSAVVDEIVEELVHAAIKTQVAA
ncbi:MAG: type IV secretion protein IcmB [Pseudomonadota bacterium]|nr:type IV secretion protein IcmB [Pseudomonadota bacterium]